MERPKSQSMNRHSYKFDRYCNIIAENVGDLLYDKFYDETSDTENQNINNVYFIENSQDINNNNKNLYNIYDEAKILELFGQERQTFIGAVKLNNYMKNLGNQYKIKKNFLVKKGENYEEDNDDLKRLPQKDICYITKKKALVKISLNRQNFLSIKNPYYSLMNKNNNNRNYNGNKKNKNSRGQNNSNKDKTLINKGSISGGEGEDYFDSENHTRQKKKFTTDYDKNKLHSLKHINSDIPVKKINQFCPIMNKTNPRAQSGKVKSNVLEIDDKSKNKNKSTNNSPIKNNKNNTSSVIGFNNNNSQQYQQNSNLIQNFYPDVSQNQTQNFINQSQNRSYYQQIPPSKIFQKHRSLSVTHKNNNNQNLTQNQNLNPNQNLNQNKNQNNKNKSQQKYDPWDLSTYSYPLPQSFCSGRLKYFHQNFSKSNSTSNIYTNKNSNISTVMNDNQHKHKGYEKHFGNSTKCPICHSWAMKIKYITELQRYKEIKGKNAIKTFNNNYQKIFAKNEEDKSNINIDNNNDYIPDVNNNKSFGIKKHNKLGYNSSNNRNRFNVYSTGGRFYSGNKKKFDDFYKNKIYKINTQNVNKHNKSINYINNNNNSGNQYIKKMGFNFYTSRVKIQRAESDRHCRKKNPSRAFDKEDTGDINVISDFPALLYYFK